MYVIGLDYGTDSVRAVLVHALTGENLSSSVFEYPRWKKGLYCNSENSQFRQHPLDYIEGLEYTIKDCLNAVNSEVRKNIKGISIDTTGSTPIAVDKEGIALALKPGFEENPHAMFILWKDHTANLEADQINALARSWHTDYTQYVGGIYSSEWFWAKILKTLRTDSKVREAAYSWVEHCDYISALLTGITDPLLLKRSRCAAGHKAMWHEDYKGLPPEDFWTTLDPLLGGLRERLFSESFTSDTAMGRLSAYWADRLGLDTTVVIGVGAFDCHMGAVGAQIEPYDFVRVMGTSTCDMLIAPKQEIGTKLIKGICGQVDGSIVTGMIGLEAGQSAFGDYYAWFQKMLLSSLEGILDEDTLLKVAEKLIPSLSNKASAIPLSFHDPIATDWINGRRTPDANHKLKATLSGLNLGSDAPILFKMIVEATAFGSKAIVDRFIREGVKINRVIAIGGVAKKSTFVMQTLSDVLDLPIKVASSDQACALGAAMNAAVASGIHKTIKEAQDAMGSGYETEYIPIPSRVNIYKELYKKYISLGNYLENNA
jgi:L-ribulokinase